MNDSTIALLIARGRIAFGLAALAAPGVVARGMGGAAGDEGLAPMFARMLGARDVALGLGTVVAIDRGTPVRGWLEGAALADSADCVAGLLARGRLTPRAFRGTVGLAAGSAVLGAFLARRLDPPQPAHPGQPEAVATGHGTHGG